eukprot:scaffold239023_cov32-Tisochrysis_lutea.AAC.2
MSPERGEDDTSARAHQKHKQPSILCRPSAAPADNGMSRGGRRANDESARAGGRAPRKEEDDPTHLALPSALALAVNGG